eukprot:8780978-Ditylum_brightwellii.AAC.1
MEQHPTTRNIDTNNNEANVACSRKSKCSYDEEEDETKSKEESSPSHNVTHKMKVSIFPAQEKQIPLPSGDSNKSRQEGTSNNRSREDYENGGEWSVLSSWRMDTGDGDDGEAKEVSENRETSDNANREERASVLSSASNKSK